MLVHFISLECYPAAKTGGLGDVVGALPKYLNQLDAEVHVFMPKFKMRWFEGKRYEYKHVSQFYLHQEQIHYGIAEVADTLETLGFRLFVVDIPGKFDRDGVYAGSDGSFFGDEVSRHICFQRAYLNYAVNDESRPDVIHCHDHHSGLIPFIIKYCHGYSKLAMTPTVFTIHNERYQGAFSWSSHHLLPQFDAWKRGFLTGITPSIL